MVKVKHPFPELLETVLDSDLVRDFSCAIDGGANIGDWSRMMADYFYVVHSFEPHPINFDALQRNLADVDNVVLHEEALFSRETTVALHNPPKRQTLTSTFISPDPNAIVHATTIDKLDLPSCGLIKLDLEGAEHDAIEGAIDTIREHKPVIIVELHYGPRFGHTIAETDKLIKWLGYSLYQESKPDRVYVAD